MKHFSIAKLLLSLLIIVCLTVAVWSGYVLFTDKTSPVWGTVIFLVNIGVLIWNISVLRSRRWRWKNPRFKWVFMSILVVFLVCAFAGIQPLSAAKDNALGVVKEGIGKLATLAKSKDNSTKIYPGQLKVYEGWAVSLDGGYWKGSTLIVKVTITNLGPRRSTHPLGESVSLVVIDSTNKIVEPEGTDPIKGSPFDKEFYPKESWSGALKFEMSPYSGETKLYMTRFSGHARRYFLFDLGSPDS